MSMLGAKRWVGDNESEYCSNCNDQFGLFNRKHHCRSCGRLLCAQCCSHWLLIPRSSMISAPSTLDDSTIPQRCCNTCSRTISGLQTELRQNNSKANATLRFDKDSSDRYLNIPISRKLETDIRKAAYTLYNFMAEKHVNEIGLIPHELLKNAKGIVFVTLLKAGFLFTGRVGTGLVIARLSDGTWSAPSAVMMSGVGWGFQAGGELTDVVLILNSQGAVNAFCSKAQVSLGTELAVSVGPIGRSAGGDVTAGSKGASAAFSYAHSKGLFVGVSLEASVIACRHDVNRQFYGMEVTPTLLLNGVQARPKAAEPLYKALEKMMSVDSPLSASRAAEQRDRLRSGSIDVDNEAPHGQSMQRYDTTDLHTPDDEWTAKRTARLQTSVERENASLAALRQRDQATRQRELEKRELQPRHGGGSFNSASYTAFAELLEGGDLDGQTQKKTQASKDDLFEEEEEEEEDEEVELGNPHRYLEQIARDSGAHHSAFVLGNGKNSWGAGQQSGDQLRQSRSGQDLDDSEKTQEEEEELGGSDTGKYEEIRF